MFSNFILVNPRLCRGDYKRLTFPGIFLHHLCRGPGVRLVRAESLGGRKVRQGIPSVFRAGEAEAPFRTQKRDLQSLSRGLLRHRFRPIQESRAASGFLRAPSLPPGLGKSWPPAGGENSIRFERFTVLQASGSAGGHDIGAKLLPPSA